MILTRRQVLSLLVVRPAQSVSLQVSVLEAFVSEGKVTAILVNHADPSARERFAQWLQTHPTSAIHVRSRTGEEAMGTIFRVRMCFGRGLILLNKPMQIRERDVLTIAT